MMERLDPYEGSPSEHESWEEWAEHSLTSDQLEIPVVKSV